MKLKPLCKLKQISIAIGICTAAFGLNAAKPPVPPDTSLVSNLMPLADAQKTYNLYRPFIIDADISKLTKGDQKALESIVSAAKIMDKIFYKQKKANGLSILNELTKPYYDPVYLKLFKINYAQWDSVILGDAPFINLQEGPIPLGIDLYPQDLTPEEWDAALAATEGTPANDALVYDFTVIRRDPGVPGGLKAIKYSEFYKDDLAGAADLLLKAASQTTDPALAKYLKSRAAAFKSNNYLESDTDWLKLTGNTDPNNKFDNLAVTIGPYEQYFDQFAGVKAQFMAHIAIIDKVETARLKFLENQRQYLIDNQPYPSVCGANGTTLCTKNDYTTGGLESPLITVNEIFSAGDYRGGGVVSAFNLPNRAENRAVGSKNTLIKNTTDQGFSAVSLLRAQKVFTPADIAKMDGNSLFLGVVTHEMAHGVTPRTMTADNADVTEELGRWYLTIEEGLADADSTWNARLLAKLGGATNPYTGLNMESFYLSFVGGYFRGNLWDLQNSSSHRRGYVIALAKHLNFADPCQPDKHAIDIDNNGIVTFNVSVPKCVNPANELSVMDMSVEELVRTYLAAEMRSNVANDNDIEAARSLYACSKEQLWGTGYSHPVSGRSGRQAEECIGAYYPGNTNFKKALQNIADDPTLPLGGFKVHPRWD